MQRIKWQGGAVVAAWMTATLATAAVGPNAVPGKEYSTRPDVDAAGIPAPEQTLWWVGNAAVNGLNYGGQRGEVDAMANRGDAYFRAVVANQASLLFNTGNESVIRFSTPTGGKGIWGTPPKVTIGSEPQRVDALEVWGGDSRPGLDADRYSLLGDPGGIAVFKANGVPWISSVDIAMAIGLGTQYLSQLDLDALMVNESGLDTRPVAGGTGVVLVDSDAVGVVREVVDFVPGRKNAGSILFSIAPITAPDGTVVFDGGEVWEWDGLAPATFLKQGGYTWDTAFDVMGTFGTRSEDVTVLEAVPVPEPSTFAAGALGLLTLGAVMRRRSRG